MNVLIALFCISVLLAFGVYAWHDLEQLIDEQLEEERLERLLDALWADDQGRAA